MAAVDFSLKSEFAGPLLGKILDPPLVILNEVNDIVICLEIYHEQVSRVKFGGYM